jgi:uncharacterized membrane protein SpoIIM required for sporulation
MIRKVILLLVGLLLAIGVLTRLVSGELWPAIYLAVGSALVLGVLYLVLLVIAFIVGTAWTFVRPKAD